MFNNHKKEFNNYCGSDNVNLHIPILITVFDYEIYTDQVIIYKNYLKSKGNLK